MKEAGNRFQEAKALIDKFLDENPTSRYGDSHHIVDDLNLEDHWLDPAITKIETVLWSIDELKARLRLFKELKEIPEDDRCPADYTINWSK